jgi:TrmH family RNA methyltransferase
VDRALPSGGRSRRFDSCREYHFDFGFEILDFGLAFIWALFTSGLLIQFSCDSRSLRSTMNHIPQITSRDNQKLKFARAVRDGHETDRIFIEGLRLGEEILKTEHKIQNVLVTSQFLQNVRGLELIEVYLSGKIEILEVETNIFNSISDTKTSQGIIIIAERPKTGQEIIEKNLSSVPFLLLLHGLNNPANLGAILRTAEAVGIEGVITTKGTTDIFSAKALRGAMGANLRLPFWTNADFSQIIQWAHKKNLKTVGADIRSNKSYLEIDWTAPSLLIIGSEGHGLSETERSQTDENLIIPMKAGVESLNAAVACGVILFEAKRQREIKVYSNG